MTISIDAANTFDKFLHSSMITALSKLGIERNFLDLIKSIYKAKPTNQTNKQTQTKKRIYLFVSY